MLTMKLFTERIKARDQISWDMYKLKFHQLSSFQKEMVDFEFKMQI